MLDVELLWVGELDVVQVSASLGEVVVCLERSQEGEAVSHVRFQYLVQELCLHVFYFLAFDKNKSILEQLCTEHHLEGLHSHFSVSLFSEVLEDRSVGDTTLPTLRSTLVSLSGSTSALLWSWLSSRATDVSLSLGDLGPELALDIEVVEYFCNDVSSKRVVEVSVVECYKKD